MDPIVLICLIIIGVICYIGVGSLIFYQLNDNDDYILVTIFLWPLTLIAELILQIRYWIQDLKERW